MAEKLGDLRVYQEAVAFWESINALLDRPGYRKNRRLAEQTSDANDSIPANISEGFEQPTDAAFAHYLFIAKGSLGEVLSRLREARSKMYITQDELGQRLRAGDNLSRSLGAFIRYLDSCGYKDRGRYKSRQRQKRRDSNAQRARGEYGKPEETTEGEGAVRAEGEGSGEKGPEGEEPDDGRPEDSGRGTRDPGRGTRDAGRGTRDEGPGTRDPG